MSTSRGVRCQARVWMIYSTHSRTDRSSWTRLHSACDSDSICASIHRSIEKPAILYLNAVNTSLLRSRQLHDPRRISLVSLRDAAALRQDRILCEPAFRRLNPICLMAPDCRAAIDHLGCAAGMDAADREVKAALACQKCTPSCTCTDNCQCGPECSCAS